MIRDVTVDDATDIKDIYNHFVHTSIVTFEEEPVSVEEMKHRIELVTQKHPWFVWEEEGRVIAYAYATDWKQRSAYKQTVETSIYLHPEHAGKGIGKKLYSHLIDHLMQADIHAIIGGISLPNLVSVALHERLGFQKVAHFKEVGYKLNKWVDVGYWELTADH